MYRKNINAMIEAWNTGKLEDLENYVHEEMMRHAPASMNSSANSLEDLKNRITEFRTAFPDLHLVVDEEMYQEGRSTIRWTFTGTNTGEGDIPPTGKAVKVSGIALAHYEDEKLKEEYVYLDTADFFTQLGLMSQAAAG